MRPKRVIDACGRDMPQASWRMTPCTGRRACGPKRLTDRPGALKLLDKLLSEYPRGDMADDAAAYARRLAPERQAPRAVAEGKAQPGKRPGESGGKVPAACPQGAA